jgi:hypothetical protein
MLIEGVILLTFLGSVIKFYSLFTTFLEHMTWLNFTLIGFEIKEYARLRASQLRSCHAAKFRCNKKYSEYMLTIVWMWFANISS